MHDVFVYGTLRRGERGHHMLGGAPFVRAAVSAPVYTMVSMGEYPALVVGGTTAIVGEIYRVDGPRLAILDDYEDVPEMYRRETVQVAGLSVQVYVLQEALAPGRPPIPSGDWLRR